MARQFSNSVESFAESLETGKMQAEMEQAARAAQKKGQKAVEQTRPQVVAAFRSMRDKLDRIIKQMEEE